MEVLIRKLPALILIVGFFACMFSTMPADAGQASQWRGFVDDDYMRDANWHNNNAPDQNADEAFIVSWPSNPDPVLRQTERIRFLTLTSGTLTITPTNELQVDWILRGTSGVVYGLVRGFGDIFQVTGTPTVEDFLYQQRGAAFAGTCTVTAGTYFRCLDDFTQGGFLTTLDIVGGATVDTGNFRLMAWEFLDVQAGGVLLINGGTYTIDWGAPYTDYFPGSTLKFVNTSVEIPFADAYGFLESDGGASVRIPLASTIQNDITATMGSNVQLIGSTIAGAVNTDGTSFVVSKDNGGTNDYGFWGTCNWTAPEAAYDTEPDESIFLMPGSTITLDADVTVANLTVNPGATLDLNGYTLTVTGNADIQGTVNGSASGGGLNVGVDCSISGTYNNYGGTLYVAGDCSISGTYNGRNGLMRIDGAATVTGTGLVDLLDSSMLQLGTGIAIDGTFRATGNRPAVTNNGAGNYAFNVSASGTVDIAGLSFFNPDTNGMVIADGATITGLDDVTFGFIGAPGVNDGTYLQILDTSQTYTFDYMFFDDECQYNVRTTNPGVSVTVDGYDGPRGGPLYENDTDSGMIDPGGTINWLNPLFGRPEIVFRSPDIGQTNVPITTTIIVEFSRWMNQSTITNVDNNEAASSYKLEDSGGGFINCNITFPDSVRAILTPDALLTSGETYTVTVKDTITDIFRVAILQNSWTFTCAPPNLLTVTETVIPAAARLEGATFLAQRLALSAGAAGLPIDVLDITLTMNGTAALSDIALVELYEDTDDDGDWTDEGAALNSGTYAASALTLTLPAFTIAPAATRNLLVVYTLADPGADTNPNSTVDADLAGVTVDPSNAVGTPMPIASDDFTIITPPAVSTTYPADMQVGVFTAITISATFNEPMDQTTIVNVDGDPGAVSSYRLIREFDGSFVNCDLSFSGSDKAQLLPDVELNSSEWYRVEIDTRVTDLAGNAIPVFYSWRFQCGAPGTWDGEVDTRWTLGQNWDTNTAPGQNDDVQIPAALAVPNNPNINFNRRIRNALMASGSLLTFNSASQLRVRQDLITQNGVDGPGTVSLNVNNARLRLDGNLFNDGRIVVIDGNDLGAVWFDGGGVLQFWSGAGVIEIQSDTERVALDQNAVVEMDSSHTIIGGEFYIRNNATMGLDLGGYMLALDFFGVNTGGHLLIDAGGTFNCEDGTLRVAGVPVINGTFNRGTGTFYYYGTAQTIVDMTYYGLRFGAGAAYDIPVGPTLVEDDFTIDAATTVNYAASTGLTVNGDWRDDGTFNAGAGSVNLGGAGIIDANTFGAGTETFNNLNITGVRTLSADDTMTVGGLMDISGTFNSGTATTINVIASQVTRTGAVNPDTGTWVYTGVGNFADFNVYNLTTSGDVTMTGGFSVLNDLLVTGGATHNVNGQTLPVGNRVMMDGAGDTLDASVPGSALTVGGDWLDNGSFVYGQSTVTFNGNTLLDVVVGADAEETMYDVRVTGSLTVQVGDNLNVINQMDVAAGATLRLENDSFLLVTAPNFTIDPAASFAPENNSTVVVSGTGTIPNVTYENLRIDGDVIQTGPVQVMGDLTVESGATFDVNGHDLTIRGDVQVDGTLDATAGGNIFIEGDWDATAGLFDDLDVNVIFNGGGTTINSLQVGAGTEVTIARDSTVTDISLDNAALTLINGASVSVTTDTTVINDSAVIFDDTNGAPDLTIAGLLIATDTDFTGNVALTAARYDIATSSFTGNAITITSTGGVGNSDFSAVTATAAYSMNINIAENLNLLSGTTIRVTDQIGNTSCMVMAAGDMTQESGVLIQASASYLESGPAPGGDASAAGNGGGGGAFWGRGGNASNVGGGGGTGAIEYRANPFLFLQKGSKGGDGDGGALGGRGGGAIRIYSGGDYYFGGTVSARGGDGEDDNIGGGGGGGSGGYVYVSIVGDFVRTGSLFNVRGGQGGSMGNDPQGGGGGGGGLIHLTSNTAGAITPEEINGGGPSFTEGVLGFGGGYGGVSPTSPWDPEYLGTQGNVRVESGGDSVTYVSLFGLSATGYDNGIVVKWGTGVEVDNWGFHVYRSTDPDTGYDRINPALIMGLGTSTSGGNYAFRDLTVLPDTTYYYLLEDVEFDGESMFHGPVHAMLAPGGSDPVGDPGTYVNIGSTDDEGGYNPPEPITGINPSGGPEIAPNVFFVADNADGIFIEIFFPDYSLVQLGAPGEALRVEMLGHGYVSSLGTPELPVRRLVLTAPEAADAHLTMLELDYRDIITIDETQLKPPVSIQKNLNDPSVGEGARTGPSWKSRRTMRGWNTLRPSTTVTTTEIELPDAYFPAESASSKMQVRNGRPYVELAANGARFNPAERKLEVYERMLLRLNFSGQMPPPDDPYPGDEPGAVAAADSLKCFIYEPGIYRMTWSEFNSSGIDMSFDPRNLRCYIGGEEIAITVTGEGDGVFDPGDEVIFFAGPCVDFYADVNVAFLVASDGPGRRSATTSAAPSGIPLAGSTTSETVVQKDGVFFNDGSVGVPMDDRWLGYALHPSWFPTLDRIINCPNVASGSHTATLRAVYYGSWETPGIDPDHLVNFYIGPGTNFIGNMTWKARTYKTADIQFDQSILTSGVNMVRSEVTLLPGADSDFLYHVRYELTYRRSWVPESDSFIGSTDQAGTHELSGFSAMPLAYDVSDPINPVTLTGGTFSSGAFRFDAVDGRRYAIAAGAGIRTPAWAVNSPSTIGSRANAYDMLIITHGDFRAPAEDLAEHRRTFDNISVLVADVEDVYDEFSHGRKSPDGIYACIARAVNEWASPPKGVLLIGDASPDPRDRYSGSDDFIPTYFIDGDIGYSASDAIYAAVCPDSDNPAVGLGRIPCRNLILADTAVQKIIAYDLSAPPGDWRKRVVLTADDEDYGSEYNDYATISDRFTIHIPLDYTVDKIYLFNPSGPALTHAKIAQAFNSGAAMFNFAGHGDRQRWASEDIFNVDDMMFMPSLWKQPFVVVSDCLTAGFDHPFTISLGEWMLLRGDAGAIAVFGSAGLTGSTGQFMLNEEIYRAAYVDGVETFGDITRIAKQVVISTPGGGSDAVWTYVLLGDPMQKLVR